MRADAAAVLAIALALLWPLAFYGGPLGFYDSVAYYRTGADAAGWLADRLLPAAPLVGDAGGGAAAEAPDPINSVRSVFYSTFVYLAARVGGLILPLALGALLGGWMIWRFLAPLRAAARAGIGVTLALVTGVAAHVSQLMPDVYAGYMILAAMIAARGGLARWEAWALAGIGLAAALFHYAHLPLALVLGAAIAALALRGGRGRAALLALAPAVLAGAANVAVSLLVSDGPSLAPARYPLVLARALEDGPAREYLARACDVPAGSEPYAICEIYDGDFPSSVQEALWSQDSIVTRSTPEQLAAIVAEEGAVVAASLRAEPAAQAAAFAVNAGRQLVRFGFGDLWTMRIERGPEAGRAGIDMDLLDAPPPGLEALEALQMAAVLASLPVLLWAVWRGAGLRAPLGVLALGLLANAAICGGLSAPADRYGARVIWLVVLAAALALASAPRVSRPPG